MVKPTKGSKPEKLLLKKLYVKESKSIREIAESLGCTKDMVYRSLQDYGIDTRNNRRRSRLQDIKLSTLEKEERNKTMPE